MKEQAGLDAMFMHATEGILIVNDDGDIIRINPAAERLFGYEQNELLGQKIEALVPRRLSKKHVEDRTRFKQNPHARSMGAGIDLYGQKKDGTEFPVEVSLSPYVTDQARFVIGFVVDITARKKAEAQLKNYSVELAKQVEDRTLILHEAIAELEKTKQELHGALQKERELNDMKSRFVSMASHEFRTPLTTILSSLSLVQRYGEQNETAKQVRHIERIKGAITNLTDILNDFLSLSKLEEGKVEYHPEPVNVQAFVQEVINEMQQSAKQGQVIHFSHQGDSKTVNADKKILKNVLLNLLSNAIKFSPEDRPIHVSTAQDDRVTINVKDSGIGIPKVEQEHMFERFFRGRNATNIQGTGLGLNIVAKYVELMRGNITFASAENEGTVFTVIFPAR